MIPKSGTIHTTPFPQRKMPSKSRPNSPSLTIETSHTSPLSFSNVCPKSIGSKQDTEETILYMYTQKEMESEIKKVFNQIKHSATERRTKHPKVWLYSEHHSFDSRKIPSLIHPS
jgi:hypothetical protein